MRISIEGNLACGKSTLLKGISSTCDVEIIPEPVEQWTDYKGYNLLKMAYENPPVYAATLQSFIQLTFVKSAEKVSRSPKTILFERSLLSARYCFTLLGRSSEKISGPSFAVLDGWFDWLAALPYTIPDKIIYLQLPPEVAYDRMIKRARGAEQTVGSEFLVDLHEAHENWLVHKKFPSPETFVVNADLPEAAVLCEVQSVLANL